MSAFAGKVLNTIAKLAADCRGATAIEYGLIASLVAVAAIQAMSVLGGEISTTFTTVSDNLAANEAPPPAADEPPPPANAETP